MAFYVGSACFDVPRLLVPLHRRLDLTSSGAGLASWVGKEEE